MRLLLLSLAMVGIVACASEPEIVEVTVEVTRVVVETQMEEVPVDVTREVLITVTPEPTAVPEATATMVAVETSAKELTVCMGREPLSLYWYSRGDAAAQAVWHAIYENDYTSLSYEYQAQGLVKLPSLADGDAVLNEVTVMAGDMVVDADGDVVVLAEGVEVVTVDNEVVAFADEPLLMPQLVAEFEMKARTWADGTAVTAADSVYSFELAANAGNAEARFAQQRTASYEVADRLATRWTGLPGFLDSDYFLNFWRPLPQHLWGELTAAELATADIAARLPVGDGPFMIEAWTEGESITLSKNPNYYRAAEGLPHFDAVEFRFVTDEAQLLAQLLAGQCDIATADGLDGVDVGFLMEAEAEGVLQHSVATGAAFDHLDFGINSFDGYGDDVGRPDWFEDVRVRQALAMCTNRSAMVERVLNGRSEILNSYVPSEHPLYAEDVTVWAYDVTAANELLDEVGFRDSDRDGVREYGRSGSDWDGTPFRITLLVEADNDIRRQIAQIFQQNMQQCGVEVQLKFESVGTFYAEGPLGEMFGRQFDMVLFAWLTEIDPACHLYLTENITGDEVAGFGGWRNFNVTGWSDEAYDGRCQSALGALADSEVYGRDHQQAQRIFAESLPTIPLFYRLNVVAAGADVVNFGADATQPSALWNLFEIDVVTP